MERDSLPRSWHNTIPSHSQVQMTLIAKVSFLKYLMENKRDNER